MLLADAIGNYDLHWLSNHCKSVRASFKSICDIGYDRADGCTRKKTDGLLDEDDLSHSKNSYLSIIDDDTFIWFDEQITKVHK